MTPSKKILLWFINMRNCSAKTMAAALISKSNNFVLLSLLNYSPLCILCQKLYDRIIPELVDYWEWCLMSTFVTFNVLEPIWSSLSVAIFTFENNLTSYWLLKMPNILASSLSFLSQSMGKFLWLLRSNICILVFNHW